ncbi:MAG: DUF58 domain-containing protein [Bacteroidetes bacterium]|nr:DUF58 domain-containing protein [Bacteroidota bacterium]
MTWKKLRKLVRYFSQYIPFTRYTFWYGVAVFISFKLLYKPIPKNTDEPIVFQPFLKLMGKFVFIFFIALIAFSLLSTLIAWLYFLWKTKGKNSSLEIQFNNKQTSDKKLHPILNAALPDAFRPILGFVQGRLFYDDHELTDRFPLLSKRKKGNGKGKDIFGTNALQLADIKEYEVRGGFVFFEDMLHLISLPVKQATSTNFYQPPSLVEIEKRETFPKRTETTDVRINEMRRVEGDYLSYKDFETGDDIRRILWKVYAKNKNLVVRIPEQFEPYASHLYFYASFHANLKAQWLNNGYLQEMLNYYKSKVWTIYTQLSKKEWEIRYIPDQPLSIPEQHNKDAFAARIIANSNWQTAKNVNDYFHPKHGAVLVISSLTDPLDLKNLLDRCEPSTVVYFIKCTEVFADLVSLNWLKRLIFLPPKDRLSTLRATWIFSPMRLQIRKREKEIETLLKTKNLSEV